MGEVEEIWRDCVGWEGRYQVSNLARVRSLLDSCLEPLTEPLIKKYYTDKSGYAVLSFYKHRKMKLVKVHRLVAEAFIPNPENKIFVNHIDGNKLNNLPSNLEWSTPLENSQHAHRTGLMNPARGENSGVSIWTEQEVINIKTDINNGLTSIELFEKYPKLDSKHLYLFRKNKTWNHLDIRVRDNLKFQNIKRRYGKLTKQQVEEIITFSRENPELSHQKIGVRFEVGQPIVSKILRGDYAKRLRQ